MLEKADGAIETLRQRLRDLSNDTVGPYRLSIEAGGASYATSVQREDNWVLLECALSSCPTHSAEEHRMVQWLRWNSRLAGGIKFVLDRKTDALLMTAEIPVNDETGLMEADIDQACAGLQQGLRAFADTSSPNGNAPTAIADGVHSESVERPDAGTSLDIEDLCRELGWSVGRRGDGRCAVESDLHDAFCEALVEPIASGMFRAMTQLTDGHVVDGLARRATEVLLLSAGRLVRMARPVAVLSRDSWAYHWEVVLSAQAAPSVWHEAFSALSIACDVSFREVQTFFEDSSIAEQYLRFRESAL